MSEDWVSTPPPVKYVGKEDLKEELSRIDATGGPSEETEIPPTFQFMELDNIAEVKATGEMVDSAFRFIVSTDDVDRMNDIIDQRGWVLRHFKRNPVVLFGHDYGNLPVARGQKGREVWTAENKTMSVAEFPVRELYEFGYTVGQLVRAKFLKTASVGFRPLKWKFVGDNDSDRKGGIDFTKQELLEWSIVPVPANPNALQRAQSEGIELRTLKSWAESVLDAQEWNDEILLSLGRDTIERNWKVLREGKSYSVPGSIEPEPKPEPNKRTDGGQGKEPGKGGASWACKNNPAHRHATAEEAMECDRNAGTAGEPEEALAKQREILRELGPDFTHDDDCPVGKIGESFRPDPDDGYKGIQYLRHHDADGTVNHQGVCDALALLAGLDPDFQPSAEATREAFNHLARHLAECFPDSPCNITGRHVEARALQRFADAYVYDPAQCKIVVMTAGERATHSAQSMARQFEAHVRENWDSIAPELGEKRAKALQTALNPIREFAGIELDTEGAPCHSSKGQSILELDNGNGGAGPEGNKRAGEPEALDIDSLDPDAIKEQVRTATKDTISAMKGRVD